MLQSPGALLLGHCKITMYITWPCWRMGALECNKARRTGLFPGTVFPAEKMHPSRAGWGGFVFGGRKCLPVTALPSVCTPWGEEGGQGRTLKLACGGGLACEVCSKRW